MKIYGKNLVRETLRANRPIHNLFIDSDFEKKEKAIMDMVKEKDVKFEILSKSQMNKIISDGHQGIIANIEDYNYKTLEEVLDSSKQQSFFILDGIEDPRNLGAMLRTADATGIDGIIIPSNRSVSLTATVAKVSTGAIEYVNLIKVSNINNCIEKLKKNNFWVIGTDAVADKSYLDIEADTSIAIVIGSEGKGISKLVKKNCDYLVNIPMRGKINSLNASVSASLLMYEILRKRR